MDSNRKSGPPRMSPMGHGGPPRGAAPQKPKNLKLTLRRLVDYLKPQSAKFIGVFFLAILSTVFTIIGPKILGKATTKLSEGVMGIYSHNMRLQSAISQNLDSSIIEGIRNEAVKGIDFSYILNIILLLLVLYIISSLFSYIMSYIMASVSQLTVRDMRTAVKDKMDKLPLKYFDNNPHGDVLSRITNDMDNIGNTLQQSLTQLITSAVTVVGILVMMFSISPLLTLVALLALPLSGLATMAITKKSQVYFAAQQRIIGELNGHVEEMYTGHNIIKAYGREKISIDTFNEINSRLKTAGWKAQFVSGIVMPVINFINNISYVIVCIAGGFLVAQGKIPIGDIQAFIQYIRQFTQPIVQISNITNILQSTIASAERVFEILDEEEEINEFHKENCEFLPKGKVVLENLTFGYSPDNILMENVNLTVEAGHMVAIVGPTGAGKTTLVNLLMRFYELKGGRILIDGCDISKIERGQLRSIFGMVLQDTWLFNGSIWDNIAYGKDDASDEEVLNAAKLAHVDDFVRTLPDGYNTILSEDASNISQGQKQLLTIARAIIADPAILILDEATSNVDTRTEVLIQKAMSNLMANRTGFIIAHRLSTIRDAKIILVMNEGKIVEKGDHNTLLKEEGFYAALYNSK